VRSLGQFGYRRRRALAAAAGLLAVATAIAGSTVFDNVKPYGFEDPDSESVRAYDALEAVTGERPVPDVELVVRPGTKNGLARATRRAAAELSGVRDIARVVTPETDRRLVSTDRRSALVLGFVFEDVGDLSDVGSEITDRFSGDGAVTAGGTAVTAHELTNTTQDDLRRIELYALPVLLLLSLLVFRGVVAAALPVLVGGLSILTTLALLNALTTVVDIDAFAINIVTGLGLGLAIDYSLFLVTRFREELEDTSSTEEAVTQTVTAIGRMIVFSGVTVALSLIALCIFPQRFLYSIGIGGALVALSSAAVCLLFLPGIFALLGQRVNALAPARLQRPPSDRPWRILGRFVLAHPMSVAIVTVAVMIFAGLPFLQVELTQSDAKSLPSRTHPHQVQEAIGTDFRSDPANRIVVVARSRRVASQARRQLADDRSIGRTSPPVQLAARVFRVEAQLRVDGYSDAAVDAVKRARSSSWGPRALIGGPPASLTDERHSLESHLPAAAIFIVVATGVLLLVMTGSVVLPAIALVMNALTVSVAFGVLVLIFQDGRLEGGLGYMSPGALDLSVPVLLFAVVFGLSTDYGVFLLQRIGEARATGTTGPDAIAAGLVRSGWQITAAAALFAVAMGAFAFSDVISVKEVAVGAAVAVLVDALLIRPLLFPALMRLAGPLAWWSPPFLRRRLGGIREL
jgi:uncharacterized membrane protein YdfJ with MMPL/SSD domain